MVVVGVGDGTILFKMEWFQLEDYINLSITDKHQFHVSHFCREYAKKHVKKERARERAELAKAWNLLDPLGHGSLAINDEKLVKLFKILRPQVKSLFFL